MVRQAPNSGPFDAIAVAFAKMDTDRVHSSLARHNCPIRRQENTAIDNAAVNNPDQWCAEKRNDPAGSQAEQLEQGPG